MESLYLQFISPENFALALKKAVRGRKTKPAIAKFLLNAEENLENIRQSVIRGEFRTSEYRTMEITDPKRRTIYILPFAPDRIVHHALMNVIAPMWERMFIKDSYSCITGRGLHAASRRCMQFCRRNEYVLKCDIRKFYPSIDHDVMYGVVLRSLGCRGGYHPPHRLKRKRKSTIWSRLRRDRADDIRPYETEQIIPLLRDIIYSIGGGKNLPIGNLCSQWMGNLYMHELDIYIKRELKVRDYLRYCDDFCLFSNDKIQLREWREKIREFITEKLKLEFSKSEIFPVKNGLDFVGYRHFKDFILLRKRTAKRIKARMLKIHETGRDKKMNTTIMGQIASAHGWMKHACSYNFRKSMCFEKLRNMI